MKDNIVEKQNLENKILETSSNFEVKGNLTKDEAWEKLRSKINFEQKSRNIQMYALKWAASVSIILGISFVILYQIGNTEVISDSEIKEIELPDGSNVTLNLNSSIAYNNIFWTFSRGVSLEGQAYFAVEKGNTFSVNTKNGKVEVLGTEFNVIDDKSAYAVYCFEGKVAVFGNNSDKEIYLAEGMATALDNKNLTRPFLFNKEQIAAWKNGLFYFEKESLQKVFEDISTYYNIDIKVNVPVEEMDFSGVFKKGDIETVMEIVCSSMGLKFVQEEDKILVSD